MPDILVCLKWVDLRPEVDPLTGEVSSDARFSGAGPVDLAALEWGLRFAERLGGTVSVATVGPPEADPMLRSGMALTVGRLRPCPIMDFRFVALSHNILPISRTAEVVDVDLGQVHRQLLREPYGGVQLELVVLRRLPPAPGPGS